MKKKAVLIVVLAVSLSELWANVPNLVDYQGRLTDDSENPLDGSYSITFSI
ncbi:MAG: hypothetical protein K8S23_12395 [Candidatus Cloacimonetes bacterium]|nr:hypothetical protein [Candidatus Cloacimonadota bacterium]